MQSPPGYCGIVVVMDSAVMGSDKTGLRWVCLGPPHVAGVSFQIEGL